MGGLCVYGGERSLGGKHSCVGGGEVTSMGAFHPWGGNIHGEGNIQGGKALGGNTW